MKTKKIAVTGAAGQITYSLLFRIANGDLFGPNQPISLHLLELSQALESLRGVVMELQDCAYPLLRDIVIGSDPEVVFDGVDYAFLVGAKPRVPGMERKDLLIDNGKIFVEQGKALNRVASKEVKVLVVGNPCNTNCLIAMQNAPNLSKHNFFAMTQLDQNRARSLLAIKAGVSVQEISDVVIWGNHSSTQVPDLFNAKVKGLPALQFINDQEAFAKEVQERGTAVLKARGKSSAASAAKAAIDAMRALVYPTPENEWYSCSLLSDQNSYGIQDGLIFSFPCRTTKEGRIEIVNGLAWNDYLRQKIKITENELIEEKKLANV